MMGRFPWQSISPLFILLLAGCGTNMKADRFDWKATESAPKKYPMQVIEGTFVYHADPNGAGLYVPSGGTVYKGWGEMVSSHIVGDDLKPLPDKLDITFFSYTENQFYHGNFDLPYETILALFREGSKDKDNPTYDRIMVGMAPGGAVAVWLTGTTQTTEVFFGQASATEGELKGFGAVISDRKGYVQSELEDSLSPEVLADIHSNGIPTGKWSEFRNKYYWNPVFMRGNSPGKGVGIKFLNGESNEFLFPLDEETLSAAKPAPKMMQFVYRSPAGWAYFYIIHFDETEMMKAFSQLGTNQEPLSLEFYPEKPITQTRIRLSNGEESVTLEKYMIEDID